MQNFPGGAYLQTDTSDIDWTATSTTVPFEQFTTKADIRLRGRAFAFKISSNAAGVNWRLGTPRIELRQDGRR